MLSRSRKFVLTRMESGVSRSMHPSRVCSIWAAVDIFLLPRRRLMSKPGIEASTSRIVDAWLWVGACLIELRRDAMAVLYVVEAVALLIADCDVGLMMVSRLGIDMIVLLLPPCVDAIEGDKLAAIRTLGGLTLARPSGWLACSGDSDDADAPVTSTGGFTMIRGKCFRSG